MKEISAGIIIYHKTEEGPKFLLLYHGGRYWNFPKGKIETKAGRETTFRAALREIQEETGLTGRDLKFNEGFKTYDKYVYTRDKNKIFKIVVYYLAEAGKKEIKISDREHSGYGWFLYRDATRLLIYSNLKNNLRRAYEIIQRKSLSSPLRCPRRPGHNLSAPRGSGR